MQRSRDSLWVDESPMRAPKHSQKTVTRVSSFVESTKHAMRYVVGAAVASLPFSVPDATQAKDGSREDVASEKVDLIEINHFYDDQGRLVFDQLLFYDWSDKDERFQLRAWRMMKNFSMLPQKNHQKNVYESIWQDGDLYRKVTGDQIKETWTQFDPELTEREFLDKGKRRELRSPKTMPCKPYPDGAMPPMPMQGGQHLPANFLPKPAK